MIYLDNAATTIKKPPAVGQAVLAALESFGNSGRGAHEGALAPARVIYDTRCRLAALFGGRPDHVVFTPNVTAALNMAILGLIGPGDHVISTDLEHNSVLRPLYLLAAERGAEVDFVPADPEGNLDYGDFERLLRPRTRAVVCTHASNLTGGVVDVARVGRLTRERGVLLIVDTAQTAGSLPVDMEDLGADVLCFTGHKGLMGPQGTGGLVLRPGVCPRPLVVGGTGVDSHSRTQPEKLPARLEAGTLNGHGIAGLGAALRWLERTGADTVRRHEREMTRRFLQGVRGIPGIRVYGSHTGPWAPIVALNIRDRDSGRIADELFRGYGIAVRSGVHCAPRLHEALGTRAQGAVRFSFSWYTTPGEIDAALNALEDLAREGAGA